MATNTSSKYDNIICKDLIHPGSPAVYQLRPKKENVGTLTRMTLGEKDPNKTNKTILLVGETGTGKSTLINALVNYAMGVEWEDDVWFQIVEDEEKSQSEGQTVVVIVYQIFGFEGKTLPYSLTIIDTPGYGNARGTEEDSIIGERLYDLLCSDDGVNEINAVGLVLKAAENRLSDGLRYIFNSAVSLFGNDMEENIVALITHSDGLTPENALKALKDANIKCAQNEEDAPLYFMFDNHQSNQKTKRNKVALKGAWDFTMDQIGQFTELLIVTSPQNLIPSAEVLRRRTRLAACIQNLQERIKSTELKQSGIQQTQEALKQHEEVMKNNEEFTVDVDEPYTCKESISEWRWSELQLNYEDAVTCNVCKENCHYPCSLAWYSEHCVVMKDSHCTVCTGKCPVSDHVKEKMIYESKTREVKKTLQDVKEKYEKTKAGSGIKLTLLETLEQKMDELQKEKDQWLEQSFQHVITLEQIALNVDSLSTHVHVDFLIEKMKERRDTEKVQTLEEMKARMEKDLGTNAVLWNTSSKYDNIICKDLIHPGSPAVYQLRPKKENFGTLTRMTLGEKDPNTTNKTILLVGETGTGKSTLINALVNYAMGVEWEDDIWFQIVEDEKKSQSEGQRVVIVYQIFGFEGKTLPYSLTIIDTPGYGNTRGTEEDSIIGERLYDLFRSDDGVNDINAVGLVLKAAENRLSDRLRYIFNSAVSLFGNDVEENIVALITHSDGLTPENALKALKDANIKCAQNEEDAPLYFMFNNHQSNQKTKRNKVALKGAWDFTMDQIGQFTELLKDTSPQNLITNVIRLAACIQNLQERIELTELKQSEIQLTQEALKQHEEEMKNDGEFMVDVPLARIFKVSIHESTSGALQLDYEKAVTCNVCEENCHYPCSQTWYPEHCVVMVKTCQECCTSGQEKGKQGTISGKECRELDHEKKQRCTVCSGKCPVSDHLVEWWTYKAQLQMVKVTLKDVEKKYEKGKADSKKLTSVLETLQKKMDELQKEKDHLLAELFQHVVKLEQIALNVDSLSTHVHVDFLIEKMKERGDIEKVQKLEEMKA